jgi:hypothetical protein
VGKVTLDNLMFVYNYYAIRDIVDRYKNGHILFCKNGLPVYLMIKFRRDIYCLCNLRHDDAPLLSSL